MDSKDKRKFRSKNVFHSFRYAIEGIIYAARNERNMKIHLFIAGCVIIFGIILNVSSVEWLFLLFAIFGVLSLELVNSAIERVVDLATKELHPLAKLAKDFAAGAVLIYAILSVIVGLIIFLPKLIALIKLL